MKRFLLLICCFLTGCVASPNFVSHTQEIDLKEFHTQNPDVKVYYDGKEQTDKIKLFRSWKDKELIIKKQGFKDYHIKLDSVFTSDLWGKDGDGKSLSSLWMLLPLNTLGICAAGGPGGDSAIVGDAEAAIFLLGICAALTSPSDVVNYVSLPFLPLWNPWKEYTAQELQKIEEHGANAKLKKAIVLEPSDELKQKCNKSGYFISNLGCTACAYKDVVVASLAESDKCVDSYGYGRFIDQYGLSHSCYDSKDVIVHLNDDECSKCKNRVLFDERRCVLITPELKKQTDWFQQKLYQDTDNAWQNGKNLKK